MRARTSRASSVPTSDTARAPAVAGFYIPILWLWIPVIAMKDFWNVSHLTVDVQTPKALAKAKTPALIVTWWTCWLGAGVAGTGVRSAGKYVSSYAGLFEGLSGLLMCIAGVACIMIISRLTRTQTELFEKTAAEPELLPAPIRANAA